MNVVIPPEFESFARRQVQAGIVASEEEAVVLALRRYLAGVGELERLIAPAIASLDRGEGVEGETFMQKLLDKAKARAETRS